MGESGGSARPDEPKSYAAEYRVFRDDGSGRWVEAHGIAIFEGEGNGRHATSFVGTMQDITGRKHHEQHEREVEAHKREFYRRTILAATEGKLMISERQEIEKTAGPAMASWQISGKEDARTAMDEVGQLMHEAGMEEQRVYEFMGCITEAAANVLKHAIQGKNVSAYN